MSSLLMRSIAEESETMTEALRAIETDVVISYTEFKNRVLPLLANRGAAFDIQQWITLTSHPNVAIRVLKDNSDEVLYHIPPFLEMAEMKTSSNINLSGFVNDLDNISSDRPAGKDTILYNVLSAFKTKDSDMVISAVDSLIVLNQIYKDHNMDEIDIDPVMIKAYEATTGKEVPLPKKTTVNVVQQPEDDIFDDEGYDLP